jgi:riboflavin kinase
MMKRTLIPVLKHLGLEGGINEYIPISSRELAQELKISQQSASKKILELLDDELIVRRLGARRQFIKLTDKGMNLLRREYSEYQRLFELADYITIRGVVSSGLGEGKYYITQKGYMDQFVEKLWFKPYEGTFNLKVSGSELSKMQLLKTLDGIPIKGFKNSGRTFGNGKCFLCEIQGVECAIMQPNRSHYEDVIEIISKYFLRDKLKVNDGDVIEIRVTL